MDENFIPINEKEKEKEKVYLTDEQLKFINRGYQYWESTSFN